jgi:hypothetical protein
MHGNGEEHGFIDGSARNMLEEKARKKGGFILPVLFLMDRSSSYPWLSLL